MVEPESLADRRSGRSISLSSWITPRMKPKLPFHGPARPLADDEEGVRDLVEACRAGRLSDVAAWIEADGPLQTKSAGQGRRNSTALAVAIETGQHDLTLLLLAAGYRMDLEAWSPVDQVLRDRRWDLLGLLLEAGADPSAVDPEAVFGTYSREVMERFWGLGVDLAGDGALAEALATATRNRPLYGFVKNHTDDPRIQREVDMGLGYAISRRNDKAVSLCLWAGASPRHSVPAMGGGYASSDDWRMTAFERAVWEGVPHYLKKLGFDPCSDHIQPLYDVAYRVAAVEALARIQPPADWHPIAERFLDLLAFSLEPDAGPRFGSTWELERIFQLGGRLREISGLTKRRLRKHLKRLTPQQSKRLLRLLEKHTVPEAFLSLIANPTFIEDYKTWGLRRTVIQELADGLGGSKIASARARRVLKQEADRPPSIYEPWNKADYVRVSREELYELVWRMPIIKGSRRYGLSDNGLRKICKKLNVPTPPRGYWAKGSTRAARLPEVREGWPTEAWLRRPRGGT